MTNRLEKIDSETLRRLARELADGEYPAWMTGGAAKHLEIIEELDRRRDAQLEKRAEVVNDYQEGDD